MTDSFRIYTSMSRCLNFMIYIQNIYLNQKEEKENMRFPYIARKLNFSNDFEVNFKELWSTLRKQIANEKNEMQTFYEGNYRFYEQLFEADLSNEESFKEIVRGFEVWWTSLAGGFSLERSVDEYGQQLYNDLVLYLEQNQIEPLKQLYISLIYDECVLVDEENISPYSAILPTQNFFMNYKDMVIKLSKCFNEA
ncbi:MULTISPECIES: hypothetical protein [Bacillus]|uniref:Group-specific protein n=2 Tax=Bacillus pseudomycoides TaxID=64104 RepID=A0AAJ1Z4J0_9BACI|nr:hypothetical protein [Bacillus pseudomycoides]KFN14411.1 hypothetical protein DJ94_1164 [Bacillus pseudomycoides]MCR8858022.1 hypothetical protein [Bacillus pseudomycoides]MDR4189647.1 hypothetical protein [Bacillus pseudomycoides]MDR4329105.1 hypothetical protein [Bacillus pseudomycoides]MED1536379.1 hypothetical protein [Bacillus pseudomycoides]